MTRSVSWGHVWEDQMFAVLNPRLFLALLMGLSLTLFQSCGRGDSSGSPRSGPAGGPPFDARGSLGAGVPVVTSVVQRADISNFFVTTTTLEAEKEVDVVARTSAHVTTIFVEEGDKVQAGTVLAQLDSTERVLQLRQSEANAADLKATLVRLKQMLEQNLVSQEAYESARYKYDSAAAQLEMAGLQLEYTKIRSPISGYVTRRNISIGDMVNTNQVVFSVADFEPLLARVFVPEKEIPKIRIGQPVAVAVEAAPKMEFAGTVRLVSPVVDAESGTVKVTVHIYDRKGVLTPGMFATVRVVTKTHRQALVMDRRALLTEREGNTVFAVKDGVARQAVIDLGISDGDRAEVVAGLSQGDTVIVVGQEGLREGQPVRMASAAADRLGGTSRAASEAQPSAPTPSTAASAGSGGAATPAAEARPGQAGQSREAQAAVPPTGAVPPSASFPGQPQRPGGGLGQMSPEQLKMMEERLLSDPRVRKAYEAKLKEDPDLATNPDKRAEFFRKLMSEMRRGEGLAPQQQSGPPPREGMIIIAD